MRPTFGPVRMGLAGGPLIVALLLGDAHRLVQSAPWGLPLAMITIALGYNLIPHVASQRAAGT